MTRPLRIEYPGAVYHVTSRGNAQQEIVHDDGDRITFFDVLKSARNRFNVGMGVHDGSVRVFMMARNTHVFCHSSPDRLSLN